MNKRKRLLRWCPNPTAPVSVNLTKRAKPIVACVLLSEIIVLLLTPMTYYAFFVPKTSDSLSQTFPLTNSEIRVAWPTLPTAEQIVNSGQPYGEIDTRNYDVSPNSNATHIFLTKKSDNNISISLTIENTTETNVPNFLGGGIIPRSYHIWLQYNSTVWVEVPEAYLAATNNPPPIPSRQQAGFLGTSMQTEYVVFAATVIVITTAVAISYFFLKPRKVLSLVSD